MSFKLDAEVMVQKVGAGAVALHVSSGQYYEMNDTAADLLEAVLETQNLDDTVTRVAENYQVSRPQLFADLENLIAELAQAGLLVLDAD